MKKRRKTVDQVVEENYWRGFFRCLENGDDIDGLEYMSNSGFYQYNECRRIAFKAGHAYCQEVLREREERLSGERKGFKWFTVSREIPGKVYAEAYGAARIAA